MTEAERSPDRFQHAYAEGVPPWDIGRPQPELVALAEAGAIKGAVLDSGCGTGENALYLATRGHDVCGVDIVANAIDAARAKAEARGVAAEFLVHDALDFGSLGRTFDAIIDSGVFHVFDDPDRPRYATSLAAALPSGGTYFMLCFSEHEPGDWGPRRVTQAEIRATFTAGWHVRDIRAAAFEPNIRPEPIRAWLAVIQRR